MISQALMPKMLMDLGNKGQASELILKLIERFLVRINTTTIHASVSEFSAICGGSLPPSPDKVTIAIYSDDAGSTKEPCYNFQIDFFLTGVHNPVPVFDQPIAPARLAELYKIYKFAIKRVDGLVEYQTGIDLEKICSSIFSLAEGKRGRMMNNDEALAKRNLSDFKRHCQLMNKACGGGLDAYIVSWMNGDGDINGASARGKIDDIAALVAAVIFQSAPYEYQLSVMENAKESLINLRIAHNLEKGLKENDQG